MLLAFWMNLYFIFFLFYFVISTLLDFHISHLLIFCFSLIPLYLIGKKKKFEIPFFKMYLCTNCISFFIIGTYSVFYNIQDSAISEKTELIKNTLLLLIIYNIPTFVALFIIYLKKITSNNNKKIHIVLNLFSILNTLFGIFWILGLFAMGLFFKGIAASMEPEYPPIEDYQKKVIELSTPETYRTKHFPQSLPTNIQNYSFKIDHEPRGWCIDTLSITTDKEYIKKLLQSQKSNIAKKINFSELENHYKHLHHNLNIENNLKNTYIVYILKNENNDEDYTSGFVISEELQQVIFFYANYNLKKIQ